MTNRQHCQWQLPRSFPDEIEYSEMIHDNIYEYRHVCLPKRITKEMLCTFPLSRALTEDEWRSLGVQQSQGWVHFMFSDVPHILFFRKPIESCKPDCHHREHLVANHIVLTVHIGVEGTDCVNVKFTSIAGEEVASLDFVAAAEAPSMCTRIARKLDFPRERLQLLLANGTILFDSEPQTRELFADWWGFQPGKLQLFLPNGDMRLDIATLRMHELSCGDA